MTESEKRTVRLASIGIAIYLACFLGWRGWRYLNQHGSDVQKLAARVQTAELELEAYENKVLKFEKLRDRSQFDPRKLPNESLVADASAAIQSAARQGGVKFGVIRENAGRSSGRELASIQFEATALATNTLALLHRVQTLGFPLVIDSIQLTPQSQPPGMVKLNFTVVILNPEHWKKAEVPDA